MSVGAVAGERWIATRAKNAAVLLREGTSPISWSGVDERGHRWQNSYSPPPGVEAQVGMAEEFDATWPWMAARLREGLVQDAFLGLNLKCFREDASKFIREVLGLPFDKEHRAAFWHVVTRSETWREKPPAEMFEALREKVLNAVGKADAAKSRRREVRYAESLGYRSWRCDSEIGDGADRLAEDRPVVWGEPVAEEEKEPRDLTALAVKAAKAGHLTLKQAALISRVRRGQPVEEARKALGCSAGVERRMVDNLRKVGM